ncbi:MAG: copper chaperone PCu(A)C [Bacteroidota bacterium]|nr:copper chaperone PCu(A)C [Bacteroidota bacterium]
MPQRITAKDAFARPAPSSAETGAAFMIIVNNTQEDDRLVSASSPAARTVELHETIVEDGVMRMQHQPQGFEIPAGGSVELRLPVVPSFYLTLPEIPYREFAVWRLALYAAAFADVGTAWDRTENPFVKDAAGGYGFGLHAVLPYSVVFRAERAWNGDGRGEWIFDIGVSF